VQLVEAVLKGVWNDPVWSKVIAGAILGASAVTASYLLNWWPHIRQGLLNAWIFFGQATVLPEWALLSLLSLLALILIWLGAGRSFFFWRTHRLVPVIFLKPSPPYNVGEVAGFQRPQAERFIVTGMARYYRRRDRLYAWWRALIRLGGSQ